MIKKKTRLKKIVIKLHASNKMKFFFSSIVDEGIKTILNFFFFTRRFHSHKKHKKRKKHKKHKNSKSYKKHKTQTSDFHSDIFYAHKKHNTSNKRFSFY